MQMNLAAKRIKPYLCKTVAINAKRDLLEVTWD